MEITRRDSLGLLGQAATGVITASAGTLTPAVARQPKLGSRAKMLFWVATITPCDRSLRFDPGAFRDILAWYRHCGADGVVVLGTTGEFPSFSKDERKHIQYAALKDANGLDVIINPGASNFPETLELAEHAQGNGAAELLVIPPFYYNNPPLAGLVRYYSMLFDRIRIPISLYHIPSVSEVPVSHDLLAALTHYPNLAGIKDSTADPQGYRGFVEAFPQLNMRTGTGNNIELAFGHGMGAILGDGNVFTRMWADVFGAFRAGKDWTVPLARLRTAQAAFENVNLWSPGPMKYALSMQMGGPQSYQRPPMADATEADKAAIRAAFDRIRATT